MDRVDTLDNFDAIAKIDKDQMLDLVARSPEMLQEAVGLVKNYLSPNLDKVKNIVIAGMGGSGIAGDI